MDLKIISPHHNHELRYAIGVTGMTKKHNNKDKPHIAKQFEAARDISNLTVALKGYKGFEL